MCDSRCSHVRVTYVLCARMRGRGDAFAGHRKSGVGFDATPIRRRRRDQSMLGQHAGSQDAHDRVSGRRKLDGSLQCVFACACYICVVCVSVRTYVRMRVQTYLHTFVRIVGCISWLCGSSACTQGVLAGCSRVVWRLPNGRNLALPRNGTTC